jgi:hypothetical protein
MELRSFWALQGVIQATVAPESDKLTMNCRGNVTALPRYSLLSGVVSILLACLSFLAHTKVFEELSPATVRVKQAATPTERKRRSPAI